MSVTQYMSSPPAGAYQWQQPQHPQHPGFYPQPQNYFYPAQQTYSPSQQGYYPPPQYQQPYSQPPPQFQQSPYLPQSWPAHAQEYVGPGVNYGQYRDEDTASYNNPSEPQYGRPESQRHNDHHHEQSTDRSDPRFVFPDSNAQQQQGPNGEGERGLGATVLGGGAGAFLGNKMHHGAMGTIGGLALGAIAANAFEHHEKKKKEERRESRAFDEGYEDGERRSRHGSRSRDVDDDYNDRRSHHGSRSRDIDDDYRSESRFDDPYEDDRYDEEYEPRHHHHHHREYDDDDYQRDDYRQDEYYDRRNDW